MSFQYPSIFLHNIPPYSMSRTTHLRRMLGTVLLVGTCLVILSFNPASASNAPGSSHIDRLPLSSLARRDLLGSLIGRPQPAPVASSPPPDHNSGSGGGDNSSSSKPSPIIPSDPEPDPDPTPDRAQTPHSSPPSSTSSKSPSSPPTSPNDGGDDNSDPKDKAPSVDASHPPTSAPTKKKTHAASPSDHSTTSSDDTSSQHSSQQRGHAETSASAAGTDNDPALGGPKDLSGSSNNSTSSRSDLDGNGQGLTSGLIALLVTVVLAITTAVLLSCYKIRQARMRSNRRRQRGLSATSGMSNLVVSSDLETLSWHENLLKSQGGHTRNQSLQSHASHPNSLHHHHQLHHQLHHPYVGGGAYDAPPTPPMAAAHIVGNRGGSPGRASQASGRDDPWRKNLGAFHRE